MCECLLQNRSAGGYQEVVPKEENKMTFSREDNVIKKGREQLDYSWINIEWREVSGERVYDSKILETTEMFREGSEGREVDDISVRKKF